MTLISWPKLSGSTVVYVYNALWWSIEESMIEQSFSKKSLLSSRVMGEEVWCLVRVRLTVEVEVDFFCL